MNSVSKNSIEKFLRNIFNSNPNFGHLTKAELRNSYIKEKKLAEFSVDEKKLFSSVVNDVIAEFMEDTEKSKVSLNSMKNGNAKKSKASKSKKRISSHDESDTDISETECNKENVDSANISDQLDENESENSDSGVSHSHVASESETEHQNNQTDDKLARDAQQDNAECKGTISSSSVNNSDDDFVSKSNFEKQKTYKGSQQLNSDIDANKSLSDADVPSGDSIEEGKLSSIKRKKSVKGKIEKPHKQQRAFVDDSSSDSDSSIPVPKEKLKKKNPKLKTSKAKLDVASSPVKQDGHDLSSDSEDKQKLQNEHPTGKNKKFKSDEVPKKSKRSPPSNGRVEHLKKYLRAAGLRIPSYDKLFESCRSQKAKVEKLLEVLHSAGMKGRPTLEKCKKLKKKIETKKDVESLDLSNIIKTEGRPKRNARSLYLESASPAANICSTPSIDHFSSLKDIIDSDESDTPVKAFSRVKNAISDDDSF